LTQASFSSVYCSRQIGQILRFGSPRIPPGSRLENDWTPTLGGTSAAIQAWAGARLPLWLHWRWRSLL
jgi:hypothetical protein